MNFKDFLITEQKQNPLLQQTLEYLEKRNKILFLTTSNRWKNAEDDGEIPKSTQLAQHLRELLGYNKVEIIDVSKLNIRCCTGSVSTKEGNRCGLKEAALKSKEKNPTGYHRCWTSFNNEDDELWKITKVLFESDCIVFFGSVRWGQTNSIYQKLIERLCWIENRRTTLGESNIVKDICAGIIFVGQQWNGEQVVETQKQVLKFYGFKVVEDICWNWQYSNNPNLETKESYIKGVESFNKQFDLNK